MRFFTCFIFIFFSVIYTPSVFAIDRLVSPTGTDTGDCSAGNCLTVTYAIAQANAGDRILVASGIYPEAIIINKSITLQGNFVGVAGNDGTRGGVAESLIQNPNNNLTTGILITVAADDVTINGLTLDGRSNFVQGIAINGFQNTIIQNNRILNLTTSNTNPNTQMNSAGIWAEGTSIGNVFQNNFIRQVSNPAINYSTGFSTTAPNPENFMFGLGISTRTNFYADILNNEIEAVVVGIRTKNYTVAGQNIAFSNNQIDAGLQGINLNNIGVNSSQFSIENNIFNFSSQGYTIALTIPFSGTQSIDLPNSALNFAIINQTVNCNNNNITGAYYGYFLFSINPAINFLLNGGDISGVAQGIACVNFDGNSTYAPSAASIQNVNMSAFAGAPVGSNNVFVNIFKASYDFHAGVYLLIASGTPNNTPTLNVSLENCTINGTTSITTNSGGIYAANFSTRTLTTLNVNNCQINDHTNRGIHLQILNVANFTNCEINNNGTGAGDTRGITIRQNATNISFINCTIHNPNASYNIYEDSQAVISLFNCSVVGGISLNIQFDTPIAVPNQNFSGCWWGSNANPNLNANLDFNPWLNVGTDTDGATRGFQGDFTYLNVNTTAHQFAPLERVQEAHDLLTEGGIVHLRAATFNETLAVSKNLSLANTGTASLNNLTISGIGKTLTLLNPLTVSNLLTMNQGIVQNTNTSILHLTNNASNALLPTNLTGDSWVNGYLERNLSTGSFYNFPVGTTANMELAQVRLNAQAGITSLLTRFNPNNPLTNPVASSFVGFSENTKTYLDLYPNGYWEISPDAGTSSDYDLLMFPTFVPFQEGAIVKRPGGTVWAADGTANLIAFGIERNGLSGFSNFAIATESIPLSSNVSELQARQNNEGILLNWEMDSQNTMKHFTLERSLNALQSEVIYEEQASPNQQFYQYLDAQLTESVYYYRLKMLTQANQTLYSPWKYIKINDKQTLVEVIYPNPTQEDLKIILNQENKTHLELIDSQGKVWLTKELNTKNTQLNLRDFPRGMYWLKIASSTQTEWKKIILE